MIQKVEISWRHREQEGVIPVEVVYSRRRTIGLEIKADGMCMPECRSAFQTST